MTSPSFLTPGSARAGGLLDDAAVLRALLRVEVAWLAALVDGGAATEHDAAAITEVAAVLAARGPEVLDPGAVEAAGNPVPPLVAAVRNALAQAGHDATAGLAHTGLTSQDVLDTALVLVARDATERVLVDLDRAVAALTRLAQEHRGTVMAGRTLTQHAVPVTFGLKAAQWLVGLADARDRVAAERDRLPVQCGGAAGTLSKAAQVVPDPLRAAEVLAQRLGLVLPDLTWHTRRSPATRLAEALSECSAVGGVVAGTVLLLGRPEIAELREAAVPGRGGSSTMPQKRNPVLAVLVRSAALQVPAHLGALHACAAATVDERADGAWHAEWPVLRRLLELTVVAASQTAELLEGLEVDATAMTERAARAADDLLAERGGTGDDQGGPDDLASYLGVTDRFIDAALARGRGVRHD